ncbi:MAG: Trp biosynthesis-associated membrane protein, partial [Micromonosporaceae bacterium]
MIGARRQLAVAVLGCAGGAGLALYAVTRAWASRVVERPAPLSPVDETYAGGDLVSWLPAVALVGLAAGIALLAT